MRRPTRPSTPVAALAALAGLLALSPVAAETIGVDEAALRELLGEGVPVVDIRRPEEWRQTGVIEGSHLLTFFDAEGRYDAAAWKAALDGLVDADEPVALICRTGRRTSLVAEWLGGRAGHATVYDVEGGITAWREAGGETVAP